MPYQLIVQKVSSAGVIEDEAYDQLPQTEKELYQRVTIEFSKDVPNHLESILDVISRDTASVKYDDKSSRNPVDDQYDPSLEDLYDQVETASMRSSIRRKD